MKEDLKKYLPFVGMILILLVTHHFISLNHNDDINSYYSVLDNTTPWKFMWDRYNTWSSRIFIELILIYVVRIPILWKTINILCYLVIALGLSYLLPGKQDITKNFWIVILLLLYPFEDMAIAGWAATTTGYFWTIGLLILSGCIIKKIFLRGHTKWYEYAIIAPMVLYGANHEQMAIFSAGALIILLVYAIRYKKPFAILIECFVLTISNCIIILLAPGNALRTHVGIEKSMPDFLNYNLFDKVYLGYSHTMNRVLTNFNILFVMFAFVLVYMVFRRTTELRHRIIGMIPVGYAFLEGVGREWEKLNFIFSQQVMLNEIGNISRRYYIANVISIVIVFSILYSLCIIYQKSSHLIINILLLGLGFITSMAMGFSPTVIASHYRTLSLFYFSIIAATLYLLLYFSEERLAKEKTFQLSMLVITILVNSDFVLKLIEYGGTIEKTY